MDKNKRERKKMCNAFYTLNKYNVPRDTLLRAKGCLNCKDIQAGAKQTKKQYRKLQKKYCKTKSTK